MLRWGFPSGPAPHFHFFVENHFQIFPLNLDRHLEFRLPSAKKVDMFGSRFGGVFEVEPIWNVKEGRGQVLDYVDELTSLQAQRQLNVNYLGIKQLDWNGTMWHVGTRPEWGARFERTLPTALGYSYIKLVADYEGDGVVAYWLESMISVPVDIPLLKPTVRNENDKRLLRPRGWQPGQPVRQPVPAFSAMEACGYGALAVAGAISAATIAEDVVTGGLGVLDDAASLAAAKTLADWGRSVVAPAGALP